MLERSRGLSRTSSGTLRKIHEHEPLKKHGRRPVLIVALLVLVVLLRCTIARRWGPARPQAVKAPNAWGWACASPSGPASPVWVESSLNLVTASRRPSCEENERAPLLG